MNTPSNMAGHNQPPLEVWRLQADEWADLDAAASLLADGQSTIISQRINDLTADGLSVAKAERQVKGSPEIDDYIKKKNAARKRANKARIAMDYAKEKLWEAKNKDANRRSEMRMTGS